ncbi:MAG: immunoglobulin domain-containing protein [Bacteroidales bacterium]|nr:immunoglobulin domain-containing protein [Bacteroidales bacterium]
MKPLFLNAAYSPSGNALKSNIAAQIETKTLIPSQVTFSFKNTGKMYRGDGYRDHAGDLRDGDSLILFAGNDTTICLAGLSFPVSGYAENFYYTSWASTGDGFFYNNSQLSTSYVPGFDDIANGRVQLYLVGICPQPDYFRMVDSINVFIVKAPQCFAGIDASVCSENNFQLYGEANSYSELLWSGSGDGTFDFTNSLNPSYFHGPLDLSLGEVSLTLTAFEISPCTMPTSNTMTLSVLRSPEVSIGNDTILCEGSELQLNAWASDYDELFWISGGDGIFSNSSVPDPVYYPGNEDIESGITELLLIAIPELPCDVFATAQMQLTINKNPLVYAGANRTICVDQNVPCDATAENYSTLHWVALGGDGYFDDPHALSPVYFPGGHEKNTGIAFILLLAEPINPCLNQGNSSFQLKLVKKPTVFAGDDNTICEGDSVQLSGDAGYFESVTWESFGDGYFLETGSLETNYYPGTADTENGGTIITLIANPLSPCVAFIADSADITIIKSAVIDAGPDAIVCNEVPVEAASLNSSAFFWITSGDGSFLNPEDLNTIYYAGQQDIQNLEVELTLLALSDAPCFQMVADSKILYFDFPSVVSYNMEDQEIFTGETLNLYFEVSSMLGITYQWFNNGLPIQNSNMPGLLIDDAGPLQAGKYHCLYSNGCYEYSSDTASVVVYDPSAQVVGINDGWSAISSFILPENTNLDVVLNPIIDQMVIMFNENGVYWPGQDVQTFYTWNSGTGYVMKTTDSNNLVIQGLVKYPMDPVQLPQGWSILPVNSTCPVMVSALFAENPSIIIIKEIGGTKLAWLEKGIFSLEKLYPGKAYEVFNASGTEISITFPGCED